VDYDYAFPLLGQPPHGVIHVWGVGLDSPWNRSVDRDGILLADEEHAVERRSDPNLAKCRDKSPVGPLTRS
jgi:hypothetical protein